MDQGKDHRQELELPGYPGQRSVNCIGLWADLRLEGAGSGWWEEQVLGSLEGAVRIEVGTVVWLRCLENLVLPKSGLWELCRVALGPGRSYLIQVCAVCVP